MDFFLYIMYMTLILSIYEYYNIYTLWKSLSQIRFIASKAISHTTMCVCYVYVGYVFLYAMACVVCVGVWKIRWKNIQHFDLCFALMFSCLAPLITLNYRRDDDWRDGNNYNADGQRFYYSHRNTHTHVHSKLFSYGIKF